MDDGLKKRLIGATVLVSLVVIFVPMLLQHEPVLEQEIVRSNIPPRPQRDFTSQVLPAESEQLALPPKQQASPPSVVAKPAPRANGNADATARPVKPAKQPPPKPRVGLSAWMIQAGSFSNRDNAQKLLLQLRKKGFSSDIEQATVKGSAVYRVLVGPEVDRAQAEKLLVRVNRQLKPLKLQGKLRRYP